MTQRKLRFALFTVFAVLLTSGVRTASAADYHIGSGTQRDGVTYFNTLEDFRTTRPLNAQLENGDSLILYKDDYSLTGQIYVAYDSSAKVVSNDMNAPRAIGTAPGSQTRHFYLDGSTNNWSKIYFEGIREISGGRPNYQNNPTDPVYNDGAGGAIYAWWHNDIYTVDLQGVTFRDNLASGYPGGGAIYYWDALNCDLTDSNFIDNKAVGYGGAMYINASTTLYMSNTTNITLGASEGRTSTFQGNLDQIQLDANGNYIEGTGQANSIDFTGAMGNHVNLYIRTAEGGTLDMQDPFRTNIASYGQYTVNIVKSGTGTWKLAGDSIVDGSGGTTIAIQEGTLHLYRDAMLDARGFNDEFNISEGARVYVSGNNTLTGTRVLFAPKSMLTFDLGYYFPGAGSTEPAPQKDVDPMLYLSGTTLQVAGTRIDVTGLPNSNTRYGDYLLIQGATSLEIGDFDLWIGESNIDVSGRVSERFGYSLGYKKDALGQVIDDTQLLLTINESDNTVLRFENPTATQWDSVTEDWLMIRAENDPSVPQANKFDSFIPGDTVQFFGSGERRIEIVDRMAVGHNTVGNWYNGVNDTTGMHVSGDGNWTFTGRGIEDFEINGIASVLYDGSGSLTFANDEANGFTDLVLAGTGTVNVSRGNLLGDGAVRFENRGTTPLASSSKLHFTGRNQTMVENRILVNGGNGNIGLENGKTVVFTNPDYETLGGSVHVADGKLWIQGNTITERVQPLQFAGNTALNGGAVAVGSQNGTAELTLDTAVVDNNSASFGGALFVQGQNSRVTVSNTYITNNNAVSDTAAPVGAPTGGHGGGVYADNGTVNISDSILDGNKAVQDGVAVYGKNADITLRDVSVTNNKAEGSGGGVYYGGGAGKALTIAASEGKTTLFSGNTSDTVYDENGNIVSGNANAVHLGAQAGGSTHLVFDTAQNGLADLRDPLKSVNNGVGAQTLVTKTGDGTLKLGGTSSLQTLTGGRTDVNVEQGTLQLYGQNELDGVEMGTVEFTGDGASVLTVGENGTLTARNGNSIAGFTQINLANGATLGFDLTNYDKAAAQPALTLTEKNNTTNWNINGWQQNINVANVDWENRYGDYTLLEIDSATQQLASENMTLLYRGTEMMKFRDFFGELSAENNTLYLTLSEDIRNGVTVWTNASGNSIWDAESFNWQGTDEGTDDLTGTEQFLHKDAVVFNAAQSGVVTVQNGGVEIGVQGENPGMVVNGDYTFKGGSIDGNGGVLKRGGGTLTFANANGYTGGTVVEGGTVAVNVADALGSGAVVLKNAETVLNFDIDIQGGGTFDNQITGNGKVIKSNTGTLRMVNQAGEQNTYSGGTAILGGVLIVDSADALGTGNVVTGIGEQNGKLVFDLSEDSTWEQSITGTGSLEVRGSDAADGLETLTLTKANTYSGGTTILSNAELVAKTLKAIGSGNIVNDGHIVFDGVSGTLTQQISGKGGVTKIGSGTLELTAVNTYYGDTNITSGRLNLRNENALQNSTVNLTGGRLTFSDLRQATLGGLSGTQNLILKNESSAALALTLGNNGRDADFSGIISGTGNIIKVGEGTQRLSGVNTYTGGTIISSGKLVSVGAGGFGSGNVRNDAEMGFEIAEGQTGTYAGQIAGSGSLHKSGLGTLTLEGNNSYTGGTFIDEGTLSISSTASLGSGDVALVKSDTSILFNNAKTEMLQQRIVGLGSVQKRGTGALIFNKNIETSGATHIYAGSAFINGNSQSETFVYNGATLGGRGYVANNVTFRSGSSQMVGQNVDAPLSQFGAKRINYEGGSTIYVKVGVNAADQVVADNGFNFAQGGGNVNVVLVNLQGDETDVETSLSKNYDVFLSKDGTMTLDGVHIANQEGTGSELTVDGSESSIRFLADADDGLGVLGYSVYGKDASRNLALNLSVFNSGATSYLNSNQREVLRGLGNADAFDVIYQQPRDFRGNTIGQLTPYIQTALPFITQRSVTQFNAMSFERLRFLREPMVLSDTEERLYRGSSYSLAHIHNKENYVWFQNYGDFLRLNPSVDVPEFQADSYGFSVGFDRGIDHHTSIGLGMGGYFSEVQANDVAQKGDVGSYLISLYGNWVSSDAWSLTGSTGFVFSSYDLERSALMFDTKLNSRHNGTTFFASLEGAKKLQFGKFELSPYVGADVILIDEEGYRERATGNSDLALWFRKSDSSSFLTTLGLRLGRSMHLLGGNIVTPTVYAAWVHDWSERDTAVRASFGDLPSFKIWGASMNKHRAVVGTNVNMTLNKRTDMFARFNAEMAHRYSAMTFHWGLRWGF